MNIRKSQIDSETGEVTWRCTDCEQWLTAGFFTRHSRAKSGLSNICRECQRWRMKLHHYGISRQQYEALLTAQGGVCAVCKCSPDSERCLHGHLVVDHCHTSGDVRGLLCSRCNATLGESMDNVSTLQALIQYIQSPPAKSSEFAP